MDQATVAKHITEESTRFILSARDDIEKSMVEKSNKFVLQQDLKYFNSTKEEQKANAKKAFCTLSVGYKNMLAYLFVKFVSEIQLVDNDGAIGLICNSADEMNEIKKLYTTEIARGNAAASLLLSKQMKFIADAAESQVDLCATAWMFNVISKFDIKAGSTLYREQDPKGYFKAKIEQVVKTKNAVFMSVTAAMFVLFLKCVSMYTCVHVWECGSTVNTEHLRAFMRLYGANDELLTVTTASIPAPVKHEKTRAGEVAIDAATTAETTTTVATTTTTIAAAVDAVAAK